MANVRITRFRVVNSTSLRAQFTHNLDPTLDETNVSITAFTPGIPDPEVVTATVSEDIMYIYTYPLTPYAYYDVEFKSVGTKRFKSADGTNFLFEDGRTNVIRALGAEDPAESITATLKQYLNRGEGIYNLDVGTIINDIANSQGSQIGRALYDIKQSRSDNYLEVDIYDERKTRGPGPWDRLNEEGAFVIVRVGTTSTNATLSGSISFTSFPSDPITLQQASIINERLVAGTGTSTFNDLILTVAYSPVISMDSLTVLYQAGGTAEYDIRSLGYQIKNPRYDTSFASTLVTLEDNQIKLSNDVLESSTFILPAAGDVLVINYKYKSLGKIVDATTVVVTQVLDATREVTPPIINDFYLEHAPVVTEDDQVATAAGIAFLDPLANPPFSDTHPAFAKEIPFRTEGLPQRVGEYSVDYTTGRVVVYGAESNEGTGNFPPVATYKYRNTFSSRLDYTYNYDTYELAASPVRDLAGEVAEISFEYEMTLVPGQDFVAQQHTEVINERIENRLATLNSLYIQHSPITNVFRVYNETSEEIYTINRFSDNTVYFSYRTAPRIMAVNKERASFTDVLHEVLILESEFTNTLGTRVFKITLINDNIIGSTEDAIGSSYNSSVTFSRADIFETELYFDAQILSETANTNRLTVGQYQIDYREGVVYVGVSASRNLDLGSVNYKNGIVKPEYPHITSVSEVYYSISNITGIAQRITYTSIGDQAITPSAYDVTDERFLNEDTTLPYINAAGQITVSDNIKAVRGIYDVYDLTNHTTITNFGAGATVAANVITLDSDGIEKTENYTVGVGGTVTVQYLTPGAAIVGVSSVIRISDNVELWDAGGSFNGYVITLSGTGTPVPGNLVRVIYNVQLNGGATPVVDYNRGDYFIDYEYLADEILVSYEYGDNKIDFRESLEIEEGDTYYVTYKIGALRDSLLNNFGTLVDVPILNSFDTSLDRETYRDALQAALQSFTKGPTVPAMSLLVSLITKIDPRITEAVFDVWSLGISNLYWDGIDYTGTPTLMSGKFDLGVLLDTSGQTITFPVSSNLRLEEGTLECWVIPEWDGLDNDATLTFGGLKRDGYTLSASSIFIGADSHNPVYDDNYTFTVNRTDTSSPIGLPSAVYTQAGLFVYYNDVTKRWYMLVKDRPDGYTYEGTIQSSGEVYDVKHIPDLGEVTDSLRSYTDKIEFIMKLDSHDAASPDGYTTGDGYVPGYSFDGITFMADDQHYIFDFGGTEATNRFSLYKDGRGYLSFEAFDNGRSPTGKHSYKVSADVSAWLAGQAHHVAISWKLDTSDRRDEMHLFIDGIEVPNILRYGGIPTAASTDRFRTVKPEYIAGTVPAVIRTEDDMITIAGSTFVRSVSVDFDAAGVVPGDIIQILESGFGTYTILTVTGHVLEISGAAPSSFSDARFTINPYAVIVSSAIDLYNNIAVSLLRGTTETELPGLRADVPGYSVDKNALLQNVLTILGDAEVGDQILVRTLGMNFRRCRDRIYLWGDVSVLKTQLPPPINLDEVKIVPVPLPLLPIGPNNAVFVGGHFLATGIATTQTSNQVEGRRLEVRITGGNVNFGTPVRVTINGTSTGGVIENLLFNAAGSQITANKWQTITSVEVEVVPLVATRDSTAVEIKEAYTITYPDGNTNYPIVRFSFKTQTGFTIEGDGSAIVSDTEGVFVDSDIGNKLVISSPASVVGTYNIVDRTSTTEIEISPAPGVAFTNGIYDIYNVSIGRSGFQNGFFTFETAGQVDGYYNLPAGYYEFDYSAWLEVPYDHTQDFTAYIGSDINGEKQAKAIIDEFRILSEIRTDTRTGESISANEDSVTTDYNALREFEPDSNTLMLLHFNSLPFINDAEFYLSSTKEYLQSGNSINSEFNQSVVITDQPLEFNNTGRLATTSEGTIEFWVSPRFDTYNDPNTRFYFDASGSIVEETTSLTAGTVQTAGRISSVISVRLQTDTQNTGTDYYAAGSIGSDFRTIQLGKALPSQQTPVKINYIQAGLAGDRISIFKDGDGFLNFNVRAGGVDYQVRQPIFWQRDTWHRIMCTYKMNSANNRDEVRLFADGEERGMVLFGAGLIFGTGVVFGQGLAGLDNSRLIADINFYDPINQFYLGSDYLRVHTAQARFDNLKLSNTARAPVVVAGQAKDINYSSNLDVVFPVVEDAFTTFLINFDQLVTKTENLAVLRDEQFGIFNFTMDIIDSFGIVTDDAKVQQIIETLITALKPAQSKATINYIE